MGKLTELLTLAQERAQSLNLPYAGAFTPQEAYEVAQLAPGAKIVDVRTTAELEWVGRIPGAVEVQWWFWPEKQRNPNFVTQLKKEISTESLLMFICRSGQRSAQAAQAAIEGGFIDCYNILEGFEGDKDANNQRNRIGGWRAAGLPWKQS